MRVITGIQSSGTLHIGNYFGSIKQMVELQDSSELFIFVADYHALTTMKSPKELRENTIDAAITYLSFGIDPAKSVIWIQSDVKEVLELYWILSNYTPMGLLERAHSYKDKIARGKSAHHGLFSYPVLMAADILLYDAKVVPVGRDQIQHVEITRDIAIKFNNEHGDIFTLPEFRVDEDVASLPGTDGAKMSKSYGNTIDIFTTQKVLKKQVGKIVTKSVPIDEPKEYKDCNVFNLAKHFLNDSEVEELKERYMGAKEGHGHFKLYLQERIWDYFKDSRERREYYINNIDEVLDILEDGASRAREFAKNKMEIVREAVGIRGGR